MLTATGMQKSVYQNLEFLNWVYSRNAAAFLRTEFQLCQPSSAEETQIYSSLSFICVWEWPRMHCITLRCAKGIFIYQKCTTWVTNPNSSSGFFRLHVSLILSYCIFREKTPASNTVSLKKKQTNKLWKAHFSPPSIFYSLSFQMLSNSQQL